MDTDPQGRVSNWYDDSKCVFDVAEATTEKEIYRLWKALHLHDFIIIDGAAAISAAAVMVSDLVIIPVTPSPLDFAACGAILAVIEARQDLRPVIARFLITKKVQQTHMLSLLKESIAETSIPALKTGTSYRQSYIKSMLDGGTIFDTKDSAAKGEISVITEEILGLLK